MKLHYRGKYDLDPASLPHGEHMPGAVKFREAGSSKKMALIANGLCIVLILLLGVPAVIRCRPYLAAGPRWQLPLGCIAPLLTLLPHELLHAVCFREDGYLYTDLAQGLLFVTGPETMSRGRFVFMSLLPNIVFGFIPYAAGMLFPKLAFLLAFGTLCIGMGAGDLYNVFNAVTQMPRGARTYLYGFNSYWYMPEK